MSFYSLKSIKIYNFKSFKGEVEISDFKQFSVIIGPNGVGKSNLLDAFGFALGDDWKAFRVQNLSELIHGAIINEPAPDRCYVTIIILLEDGNEKSFTRTLHRNSEKMQYEIDKTVVSSAKYQEELNYIGIFDNGKNCLIFQGEIDSIAIQDAKSRCSFFEDMSGSIHFKAEYERSKQEVKKFQEVVQNIYQMKKLVTHQEKMLSSGIKNSNLLIRLQEEERDLESKIKLFHLFHIEHDIKELDNTLQSLSNERNNLQKQSSAAEVELVSLKTAIENEKKAEVQMETEIERIEIKLKEINIQLVGKEKKITYLGELKDKASKNLASVVKKLESNKNNIRKLEENKEIFEAQLAVYDQESSSNSYSPNIYQSLDEQKVKKYRQLKLEAGKQTSVDNHELELKILELQTVQNRLENEIRKKEEITRVIQDSTKNYQKLQEEIDKLQQQFTATDTLLKKEENCLLNLEKEVIEARKKIPKLQYESNKITEDLKNYEDDHHFLWRSQMKAKCIKNLRDKFPGVIGRLIDLCHPKDPIYRIAFMKIFKVHADHIVTKTTSTAKECIQYLKNKKLGTETFIPLDNIHPQSIDERLRHIKDPQNVKLAYDLLEYPLEIELAIRSVTKNTLVCETMQDACRLSHSLGKERGRFLGHDCVSLNGTLFDKKGNISGGRADLIREAGRWDNKIVEKLKSEKENIEEELKIVLRKIRDESIIIRIRSKVQSLSKANEFILNNLKSLVQDQGAVKSKLYDLKAKEEEISNTVKEIQKIISEKEDAIKVIKQKITDIQDIIFNEFCEEIGCKNIREYEGEDFRLYQQRREKIDNLKEHLNHIENQLIFEKQHDFEAEISKWKNLEVQIQAELNEEIKEETVINEEMKKVQAKLQIELSKLKEKKSEIGEAMKTCVEYENFIRSNMKKFEKFTEKFLELNEKKVKLRQEIKEILQCCQRKRIPIPLLSGNLNSFASSPENEEEIDIEIDYSNLPENYNNRSNKSEIENDLNKQMQQIQANLQLRASNTPVEGERLRQMKREQQIIKRKHTSALLEANRASRKFEDVKKKRVDAFILFLEQVSDVLDDTYKRLTESDSAQAILIAQNPEEPYLDGIIYTCVAPGKKALSIDALSGAEKSIAAFALLLAIQKARPTPFILLDEIDAAVDHVNLKKITSYIQKEKSLQFIVVSLKLGFFRQANELIGITVGEGPTLPSIPFLFDLDKYLK